MAPMQDTPPLVTGAARLVMIEDHHMVAVALAGLLDREHDLEVVDVATSIEAGLVAVARHRPDVVLTDLCLPDGEITDRLDDLRRCSPASRVLVMTGSSSHRSLLEAIDGGVLGFVDKAGPPTELVDAVRRVSAGELVVSAALTPVLVGRLGAAGRAARNQLTRRELDVLQRLARGASTAGMASEMFLSAHTVRNHIGRAMLKLGAHSRLEAVGEATRRGLIGPY